MTLYTVLSTAECSSAFDLPSRHPAHPPIALLRAQQIPQQRRISATTTSAPPLGAAPVSSPT